MVAYHGSFSFVTFDLGNEIFKPFRVILLLYGE